jgi:hypothetical protein
LASLIILALLFVACGDDESVTNPPESYGSADANAEFTLSGAGSGTFDAELGFLKSGEEVLVTLGEEVNDIAIVISILEAKTGTFSIPDESTITYVNQTDALMAEMHTGIVTINELSTTSVNGSFSGSGYVIDMTTLTTDSTKVLTITGTFSL